MGRVTELQFEPGHEVRSLVWSGETVVDIAGGQPSIGMDGLLTTRNINWAYDFDRALLSPSGLRVLYTVLGTKGLIATAQHEIREINRSYYHASAFEYPIAIGLSPDGREVLAHCPDGYNRLTIETLSEGERLSSAGSNATDVFHSRLQFSPDGRYLLSAGWIWHPLEIVTVYDIEHAFADEKYLEGHNLDIQPDINGEVDGACWLDADTLLISTKPEGEIIDEDSSGLLPGSLGVWSIPEGEWVACNKLQGPTGTLNRVGDNVLCLYDHPRLIDPVTAKVIDEWPQIRTGEQSGSVLLATSPIPPFALDSLNSRFAVARHGAVDVVEPYK